MRRLVPFLCSLALLAGAAARADQAAPLELRFGSFFRQPVGPRGLELSETLRAADGREVLLRGYVVVQERPQPGRFWLTPRPLRLSEHADGEADDLPPGTVTVLLDPAQRERIVLAHAGEGPMTLRGRLEAGRSEDPASGRVSWLRLQLAPDGLAEAPAAASPSSHAH